MPLEHGHGRSNCESLFAIPKIPSDNHIRDLLDPAEPALLDPVFAETLAALERMAGGLASFRRLGDHVLLCPMSSTLRATSCALYNSER